MREGQIEAFRYIEDLKTEPDLAQPPGESAEAAWRRHFPHAPTWEATLERGTRLYYLCGGHEGLVGALPDSEMWEDIDIASARAFGMSVMRKRPWIKALCGAGQHIWKAITTPGFERDEELLEVLKTRGWEEMSDEERAAKLVPLARMTCTC